MLFLMLILAMPIAYSAAIHGTIYDLSLDIANNIIVKVDTEPKQSFISKNGSYSFDVPEGSYTVKAEQYIGDLLKASVAENITIKDDGNYVVDLILFPSIEDEIGELDIEINGGVVESDNKTIYILTAAILVLVLIIILFVFSYNKNADKIAEKQKEEEHDLGQIVKILRQEGGRATQKEIRRQIPLSEAKISLMIAELEHKEIIEKIKKGRGNIIILKKK